jgi:hypothetical protein
MSPLAPANLPLGDMVSNPRKRQGAPRTVSGRDRGYDRYGCVPEFQQTGFARTNDDGLSKPAMRKLSIAGTAPVVAISVSRASIRARWRRGLDGPPLHRAQPSVHTSCRVRRAQLLIRRRTSLRQAISAAPVVLGEMGMSMDTTSSDRGLASLTTWCPETQNELSATQNPSIIQTLLLIA